MELAVSEISRWIESGQRKYVCLTGVHGVMEAQRCRELREVHNRAGLTLPDGMPMVWAARWAGANWVSRVYGPDLMLSFLEVAARRRWRVYLYGGREGLADRLAEALLQRFPGVQLAGTWTPPFGDLGNWVDHDAVESINRSHADVVWVGLSTPKQERWMSRHRPLLEAPVLIGVGAAFDMLAGDLPQAPPWVRRSGLEWLFRLCQEPGRLWRRYLGNNPRFALSILRRPPRLVR
jgi:N-acetylglucosaminyldiphosphoundecaprenol N-acetyl-beta-D-mannosaminyltransferase